jgi:3-deoxy-D-manno-octulosonate 8-phosphate phosphatase (KDO 8-P phosphatase)
LAIRAVVLDIDGVLTDGTFWWGPNEEELKRFSFADVMGIARAQRAGVLFALVSGEAGAIAERLARKLAVTDLFLNCKDKSGAVKRFASEKGVDLAEVCFMGNDINDLSAMAAVGLAAAPVDAERAVRAQAGFISVRPAGHGAVRDLIDHLFPETFKP